MGLMKSLDGRLAEPAEGEFLNGGREWTAEQPNEMMRAIAKGMPFYGWYGVETNDASDRPYGEKLFDLSVQFTYSDVELAADRVIQHIKDKGPFDVIVSFSQGCIVSHLVAGLLRQRGEEVPWSLSVLF